MAVAVEGIMLVLEGRYKPSKFVILNSNTAAGHPTSRDKAVPSLSYGHASIHHERVKVLV